MKRIRLRTPTAGWHHFKDSSKWKLVRHRDGALASLLVMPNKTQLIVWVGADGYLNLKSSAGLSERAALASKKLDGKPFDAQATFLSLVDDPGAWTGDDDFDDRVQVASTKRSAMDDTSDPNTGTAYDGDTGGTGDLGGGGVAGGDPGSGGDAGGDVSGADIGANDAFATACGISEDYIIDASTLTCQDLINALNHAVAAFNAATILAIAGCAVGFATGGLAFVLCVGGLAESSYALLTMQEAYRNAQKAGCVR